MIPIQITHRDLAPSDAVTHYVQKRAEKLEQVLERIVGCRVVLESAQGRHPKGGHRYHAKIELSLPGAEIVVGDRRGQGEEDLYACIDRSFEEAVLALEKHVRKHHPTSVTRPWSS